MTSLSRFRPRALLAVPILLLLSAAVHAQATARVQTEENFRRVPDGEVLARLDPGASVSVVGRDGQWREVVVEGWIWTRSLQMADQEGLDLVVSASEGENLRFEPSGEIMGRLEEGTLLEELERRPGWIRARRRGWMWAPSLVETAVETPDPPVEEAEGPSAGSAPSTPEAASRRPTGVARIGTSGAAILTAPDGDTLAHAAAGRELEITARRGSWVRVRLEGWTWLPEAGEETETEAGDGAPLTPTDLAGNAEAHRGRVVTWSLQFISLEEAERIRTDFFEGEPFLLTRYGGSDGSFVYVAVPPERLGEMEGLTPLERLTVTGRVRTGASALTGTPILDLMTLVRDGDNR